MVAAGSSEWKMFETRCNAGGGGALVLGCSTVMSLNLISTHDVFATNSIWLTLMRNDTKRMAAKFSNEWIN